MNIWTYTQESWSVFQKTGNYEVLKFKKNKFKDQNDIVSRFYIWINEGAMGVDKLFDLTGGFEKWKDMLLFIMPLIGCGNLMILFYFIIISFA